MSDIDIEMGAYEILTNTDKTRWLLIDKLGSDEWEFDTLSEVLEKIALEIESVEL